MDHLSSSERPRDAITKPVEGSLPLLARWTRLDAEAARDSGDEVSDREAAAVLCEKLPREVLSHAWLEFKARSLWRERVGW
jgi:hypothetical protein